MSQWLCFPGCSDLHLLDMLTPTERKRQGYIHELIVTEENYVNDLQLVTEVMAAMGASLGVGGLGTLAEGRRGASVKEGRTLRGFLTCGEHLDGKSQSRFIPERRWLNSHPWPSESSLWRGRHHSCQGMTESMRRCVEGVAWAGA